MGNREKNYYKEGEHVLLRREKNTFFEDWEILSIIDEGSSAVCYLARTGAKRGRLKAYNPISLPNTKNGLETFITAYKMLDDIKYRDSRFEILNNYIAYHEILFSGNKDGSIDGAFIWTPDDKSGIEFSKYLDDLRKKDDVNAVEAMNEIAETIFTLTDCVCLLHLTGILHLDLKPSNFLVSYDSTRRLNTGNISLFDINTIYSIESDNEAAAGTVGYCAPEVFKGYADNRSDIYSIGAILFSAVADHDEYPGGLYRDEYYDALDELPKHSKLLRGVLNEVGEEPVELFLKILKLCLAMNRNDRYEYAELLKSDLQELTDTLGHRKGQGPSHRTVSNDAKAVTRKRLRIGVAAAICVCAVLLLLSKLRSNDKGNLQPSEDTAKTEAGLLSEDTTNAEAGLLNSANETETDEAKAEKKLSYTDIAAFFESERPLSTFTLTEDLTIPSGAEFVIPKGKTLELEKDVKLILSAGDDKTAPAKVINYGRIKCSEINQLIFKNPGLAIDNVPSAVFMEHSSLATGDYKMEYRCVADSLELTQLEHDKISTLSFDGFKYFWVVDSDIYVEGEGFDAGQFWYKYAYDKSPRVFVNGDVMAINDATGRLCREYYQALYDRGDMIRRYLAAEEAVPVEEYYQLGLRNGEDEARGAFSNASRTKQSEASERREKGLLPEAYVIADKYLIGQSERIHADRPLNVQGITAIIPESTKISLKEDREGLSVRATGTLAIENINSLVEDSCNEWTVLLSENSFLVLNDVVIEVPVVEDVFLENNYALLCCSNNKVVLEVWGKCIVHGTKEALLRTGIVYNVIDYSIVVGTTGIFFTDDPDSDEEHVQSELNRLQSEIDYHLWRSDADHIYHLVVDRTYEVNDGETLWVPDWVELEFAEGAELIVHPGGNVEYFTPP